MCLRPRELFPRLFCYPIYMCMRKRVCSSKCCQQKATRTITRATVFATTRYCTVTLRTSNMAVYKAIACYRHALHIVVPPGNHWPYTAFGIWITTDPERRNIPTEKHHQNIATRFSVQLSAVKATETGDHWCMLSMCARGQPNSITECGRPPPAGHEAIYRCPGILA